MAEYIEREALMRNFCGYDLTKCVKYGNENAEQQHDSYSTMMMYEIAYEIEDAPAADVAPVVHGRWSKFYKSGNMVEEGFVSSCCDMWNERRSNFCPNCGARMDGDEK